MARTPNPPILYSFRRCPYAMRARLAIYASGMEVELREVVLRDKPAEMLAISPKGTVPVLQLAGERIIEESYEIMLYALKQSDPFQWLPVDMRGTDKLIKANDKDFKNALDRYKYPNRYPNEDCSQSFESACIVLSDLNERLIANNGALITDRKTLADYAILPFIRQFAHVDKERFYALPYPALHTWLKSFLESDIFQAIMPKFEQWTPQSNPVTFKRVTDAL